MHRACSTSHVKGLSLFSRVPSPWHRCHVGLAKPFQFRNLAVDHRLKNTGLLKPFSTLTSTRIPAPKYARQISWSFKSQARAADFTESPDNEQDVARAAILDKVMKGRQPTDLMLRCTVLDAEGNVKTISGQFKKSDLSAEHRLNARDLRKIDSRIPNLVPTILVRKEAILVNILHIRALVKADAVILFDTYGSADSRLHSVFLYHLEHNLKAKGAGPPYEFRALESILLSVLSALEAEMVFIRNLVEEALDEVLGQDEDMDAMYLSDKKAGRAVTEHEELEVLLESFSKQVEEIVNEAENIESNVQSTQEIVELILDSNRNALLALDLQVSIATLGIGSGALVAGLFGMNLMSHLEQHPYGFYIMAAFSSGLAFLVAWTGFRRLSKIRKVGLSSTAQKRKPTRKPWLPLPLRNRIPGGWS
ncbi:hypothetical protein D9613_008700 [Agrocybe pediades]|uniref:Magnesium transporter n=1 Tax=Agrocybe pediades TaxID=84607 RepID=A0A8H4VP80_9AGAR|nr:hypothetical protein D9613_008700 [Agrocybe pediades]